MAVWNKRRMDPEEREVIKKTRDKNKDMAKSEKAKADSKKPRATHGMLPDVAKKIDEERAKKKKMNSKDFSTSPPTSKEKGEPKQKPYQAITDKPKKKTLPPPTGTLEAYNRGEFNKKTPPVPKEDDAATPYGPKERTGKTPKSGPSAAPKAPPVPKSKPAAPKKSAAPVKTGGADTTAKGKAMQNKTMDAATKKSAPKNDSMMEDKKSNRKYESKIPTVFGIPLKVTKDKEQSRNPAEERMFGRER